MRIVFDDLYRKVPWEKIDTVVFDVGNVLLRFLPQMILEELVPEVPDLHEELLQRIFRSPYWLMRDRGIATKEEAIEGMCLNHEELRPYITKVMTQWVDLKEVIPEGVDALKSCIQNGKKVFVLSNYADDAFEVVDHKFDFFRLFNGIVVSGRIKMIKPELVIYRYLTDKFGLDPERTLFVDDNTANIEAALQAGWQGIVYDRPGKLTDFFK